MRLTNAFSKGKPDNLKAEVTDRIWGIEDLFRE
jgi:hypothetical protein